MATCGSQARRAARSSGKQIEKSHHSAPSPEHVSPAYHPPVLARAHAHQFIQSQEGGSDAVSHKKEQPVAADPPASNKMFAGQGAYRARMYQRHIS
ncbi:hypothetical protein M405DRAFT_866840 [Rhizopogon salebrosus TDB-379]|nr:hypothetical protein M405DRAFT_866840 [Rhizopogon salebrosus TDB-379]